jgi:putative sigma-54 modulation protein
VTDKLEQQVRRLKDRLRSHRGRADAPTVAALLSENLANGGESDSPADAPSLPDVVRRKRFAIKPMTAEEASLQMELLNHDFFAFQDASSGQVHILYHRQDGNYGLLELEI